MEEPFSEWVRQRKTHGDIDELWCGKIQSLCDGRSCADCHMFSRTTVESRSILSNPSLTDFKRKGVIQDDEE